MGLRNETEAGLLQNRAHSGRVVLGHFVDPDHEFNVGATAVMRHSGKQSVL